MTGKGGDIYGDKISIHALREEGDSDTKHPYAVNDISIHALREEGDHLRKARDRQAIRHFNPRPP